ncbi:hypothetical protein D3C75_813090 [compost metagenome]
MTAFVGGVVVVDDIAFGNVITEEAGDAFHRGDQRAQMDRDVLALQDHFRQMVEQRV